MISSRIRCTLGGPRRACPTLVCTWQAPEIFGLDLMRRAVVRLQVKPWSLGCLDRLMTVIGRNTSSAGSSGQQGSARLVV